VNNCKGKKKWKRPAPEDQKLGSLKGGKRGKKFRKYKKRVLFE